MGDVIALDNPAHGASFVRELVARCEALSDLPRRFGLVPGHESSGLRRLAHQGYLIFFTIETNRFSVVRIPHGAMDYERVLFPEED